MTEEFEGAKSDNSQLHLSDWELFSFFDET